MWEYAKIIFAIFTLLQYGVNNNILSVEDEISVNLNNIFLSTPVEITGNSEYIIWVEKRSLKFFSKNGDLKFLYENEGRGPGEVLKIDDVYVDNNDVYIFDNSLKKIVHVKIIKNKLNHLSDNYINVINSRNFTVDKDNNFIFLHPHSSRIQLSSISVFDSLGNKMGEYGKVPVRAALSRGLAGGGVTSNQQNIYYSYMGDPAVYSINSLTGDLSRYEDIPNYFTEARIDKVQEIERDFSALIKYAFRVSRIKHIFRHNNFIIQVVEDGGVAMESELSYYLEIWEGKKKIVSKVPISSPYVFSDDNYIYSLAGSVSDLLAKKSTVNLFIKYKLNID